MNTMNIPGFTAESALFAPQKTYCESGAFLDPLAIAVLPQIKNTGGGPGNEGTCVGNYMGCVIKCADKYPPSDDSPNNFNGEFRKGCNDSCSANMDACQREMRTIWGTSTWGAKARVGFLGQ